MGLLVNEQEIVQNAMKQLMPLLDRVADELTLQLREVVSWLTFCIFICTITYLVREYLKERRERRLHAEQLRQLQRAGNGRSMAE